jgi:hypothetical protein
MLRLTDSLMPLLAVGFWATCIQASPVLLCTESNNGATQGNAADHLKEGGCIAKIPTAVPVLEVASDGEVPFHPFDVSLDVSDAIKLNGHWTEDPAYTSAFAKGFWEKRRDNIWVLPADTPCGNENEPSCEPIAKWDLIGKKWAAGTPDILYMLEPGGGLSDVILLSNTGPGGSAAITFSSDPNLIPEPGALTLLGLGLALTAFATRARKRFA